MFRLELVLGLIAILFVWQQQQIIGELRSEIGELRSEVYQTHKLFEKERNEQQKESYRFRKELQKLSTKYEELKKMVVAYKGQLQNVLHLLNNLTREVKGIKEEHERSEAMLDDKIDLTQKKNTELITDLTSNVKAVDEEHEGSLAQLDDKIDSNQRKYNESLVNLAEFFANDITEWKNKTFERLHQLESRPPVTIENKVVMEYHVQKVEPQLSWSERFGQFFGGVIQKGAATLFSSALKAIGL